MISSPAGRRTGRDRTGFHMRTTWEAERNGNGGEERPRPLGIRDTRRQRGRPAAPSSAPLGNRPHEVRHPRDNSISSSNKSPSCRQLNLSVFHTIYNPSLPPPSTPSPPSPCLSRTVRHVSFHLRHQPLTQLRPDKFPSSAAFDLISQALSSSDAERKDAIKKGGVIFAFTLKNGGETDSWYIDLKETGKVGKGTAPEGKKAAGMSLTHTIRAAQEARY